jgi:hypothetical protein
MPQHPGPMIGPAFVKTMAAYNAEMNRRVYAAARRFSDHQRRLHALITAAGEPTGDTDLFLVVDTPVAAASSP